MAAKATACRDNRDPICPAEALAVAEGLFWSYVRDLKSHEAALETRHAGDIDPAELKAAINSAKGVREALHLMMAERNKVDKLRKDIAGGVGGGGLDLDDARHEIGRRLACLRRAGTG
ncbi:permease [Paracoccus sp. (in: a-proteobacteria)]|uniref:permease n=1 Tax=Paracoccus sp. TaxID=267 RepID=UPI0026DF726F|nr:permease [Paracoccus sp. (in: a-proteobacteria)]MDO5647976.1 permease [Paracoccus sp. (in: a-proteobacteria)]